MNLRAFRNEANSKLKSNFFFKTANNKYILNNKIKNNQQLDKFLQIHFLYISSYKRNEFIDRSFTLFFSYKLLFETTKLTTIELTNTNFHATIV